MSGGRLDEQLRRAIELEDLTADVSVQFSASAIDGLLLALRGHLDEAETKMFVIRRHYLDRGAKRDLMAIAGYRAIVAMLHGRFDDASAIAEEALERSEQLGGNSINVIPLSVRAAVAAYRGHDDEARRDATTALEAARRLEMPSMTAWPLMTMAFLDVAKGDYVAALTTWEPLLDELRGRTERRSGERLRITRCHRGDDQPRPTRGGTAVARALGERTASRWTVHGYWRLARAAAAYCSQREGNIDAAIKVAEQLGMREYERLPMPFERARTLLLLGQLYRRKRRKQKAVDTLTEALQTFEKLGARVWAQQARAELSRISVGAARRTSSCRRRNSGWRIWPHPE